MKTIDDEVKQRFIGKKETKAEELGNKVSKELFDGEEPTEYNDVEKVLIEMVKNPENKQKFDEKAVKEFVDKVENGIELKNN